MRVLATEGFNSKLLSYSDQEFQGKLLTFVNTLSNVDSFAEIQNQFDVSVNNVYVHKIDDYRIFFSVDGTEGNRTIILADLIKKETHNPRQSFRNPISNRTLNPSFNRLINPNFNRTINPIYNRTINPIYNRTINPIYNRTINPIYNRTINPIYNRTINPIYNRTINPIYNRTINPKFNPSFNGFILYDLNSSPTSYFVKGNNNILIHFNFDNGMIGIGAPFTKGYAIFNSSNQQTSYLIEDNAQGYNQFDMSGNWIGHVK